MLRIALRVRLRLRLASLLTASAQDDTTISSPLLNKLKSWSVLGGGRASPLSKLGGQARFQGSTFVQLKFDYTVPENEILSVSKTVQPH